MKLLYWVMKVESSCILTCKTNILTTKKKRPGPKEVKTKNI